MPPKRPLLKRRRSSYDFFELNTPKEERKELRDKWKLMSPEEKSPYQIMAEKEDENYKNKRSSGKYVIQSTGSGKERTNDHEMKLRKKRPRDVAETYAQSSSSTDVPSSKPIGKGKRRAKDGGACGGGGDGGASLSKKAKPVAKVEDIEEEGEEEEVA
ncbi:uncharacterized protein LOC127833307 [Dreissena polymorpha]|uniref:HMG box domain-containing protein n=1 Tax=Dreissena polymorpha TaxID=45954 RepID=A0A9D4JME1_DREPO|nr:uncharacterized protein LOC127833307 [Dreissena polymorpha]XP_052214451.1 uncharacterized protein LOC127833307 [Dreissena polymorpha]XP_052214452.1 uncharacterized protein LOC127833307 [Dreissena polymorpha]KAH3812752.1 hypothetical protein DPMN_141191 [Dreissena polymorpha]